MSFNKFLQILIILLLGIFIPLKIEAAILYLEPSSGEYHQGDTFIVEVKLDTEGEYINAVKANLIFPQDILEVKDLSQGNSILSLWLKTPEVNQQFISFSGGIPGGFDGEDGKLASIIFQVVSPLAKNEVSPRPAEVVFQEDCQVLLNDGLGTKANLSTRGAVFTIFAEKLEVPKNQWQEELSKDTIPPEKFLPEIGQDPKIFEGKYFLSFSTTDKQTGVSYYEVKEGKRDWKEAQIPYLLEDQTLQSIIKVKAVDKAGNERIEKIKPAITWKDWIAWLILFLIAVGIIWWLIIKKSKKRNE